MTEYSERDMQKIQEELAAPTPREHVQWKPTDVRFHDRDGGFSALALAYADARFVQNRLDFVVGAFNWQTDTRVEAGLLMVGIGILHPKSGEWIWKWDTGQGGEDDRGGFGGGKGLFSAGFKRAAYQWGIARDLYDLPSARCRCKGYSVNQGKKHLFRGWLESPWAKAESPETGRPHRSQVETGDPTDESEATVEFIPAGSTTYFTVAYNKMKIDKDQAKQALDPFIDKTTGEIDYEKAIIALEKNLPENERDFTKQQAELAKQKKES